MLNITGSLVYDTPVMRNLVTVAPTLKPALRKVADFILRNPMRSATMNIDEIATATGASTAAVNRLAHAIDLAGFTGLRAALVENLLALISPSDKVRHELNQRPGRAFALELQVRVIKGNMDATLAANAEATFGQVADALVNANRVYTLGFGTCHHLAGLAAGAFLPVCHQAVSVSTDGGGEAAAYRLAAIGPQDVLLAFSLPPYSEDVTALARYAQGRNATVLAVTDSPASPLARLASQTLYAPTTHPVLGESTSSALGIIEALASAIRHRCEGKASQAIRQAQEALNSLRMHAGKG
ncbi:MurR/RpiR family transcriptional regulator [Pseudomonas sp. RIT-PI-S]|uniref:MurR/RpiR family transcriptional regulator n=1 Tax=Pseudomonas sp. RIT-PI-S TaxID=3035295 RepID=UPI0021D9ADEC|nr:MurR/RpiR family transcriptional regulator [Pseudomonas sp. RIT-PI-S]